MIKPRLDFYVLKANDPKKLLIADDSIWEFIANKPAIIEILLPGFNTPIVHYYEKNAINGFNSVNLSYNCYTTCGCECEDFNDLPDGLYEITIKGSPDSFSKKKYHLKTDILGIKLARLFYDMHLECNLVDQSQKKHLEEVDFLIKAAEANVRLANIDEAMEIFNKAVALVDRISKVK